MIHPERDLSRYPVDTIYNQLLEILILMAQTIMTKKRYEDFS